jgi:hypothetical protein
MADDTADIEERIAAMARQWIPNGQALIAQGPRVPTILEFCHTDPVEPESPEVEGPLRPGNH